VACARTRRIEQRSFIDAAAAVATIVRHANKDLTGARASVAIAGAKRHVVHATVPVRRALRPNEGRARSDPTRVRARIPALIVRVVVPVMGVVAIATVPTTAAGTGSGIAFVIDAVSGDRLVLPDPGDGRGDLVPIGISEF